MKPMQLGELQQMAVAPYNLTLRAGLQTGDVVFCVGRYTFSRLIQLATGSPISHVGIVVELLGRIMLLEAVENHGVRLTPLSRLLRGPRAYKGMVFVARSRQLTIGYPERAARWALDHLGSPYSYLTIAALAWRIAWQQPRGSDPDRKGWICSEFAARWLALAGAGVEVERERLLTPADLWAHSSLSLLARLR